MDLENHMYWKTKNKKWDFKLSLKEISLPFYFYISEWPWKADGWFWQFGFLFFHLTRYCKW